MSLQPAPRDPRRSAQERAELRTFLRYDPLRDRPDEPPAPERFEPPLAPGARPLRTIALTCMLGATSLLTLLAMSMAQVTSEAVAQAAHHRALVALAETNALAVLHTAELQSQLDAGAERLTLPDYVVRDAAVARVDAVDDAGTLAVETLSTALLTDAARLAYEDGPGAFGGVASGDALQRVLREALTRRVHDTAVTGVAVGLGVVVLLGVLLARAARRHSLLTYALAALATGAGTYAAALVAMSALGSLEVEAAGSVRAEHVEIARALLAVPLRNGAIAAGLGVAFLALWGLRTRAR